MTPALQLDSSWPRPVVSMQSSSGDVQPPANISRSLSRPGALLLSEEPSLLLGNVKVVCRSNKNFKKLQILVFELTGLLAYKVMGGSDKKLQWEGYTFHSAGCGLFRPTDIIDHFSIDQMTFQS